MDFLKDPAVATGVSVRSSVAREARLRKFAITIYACWYVTLLFSATALVAHPLFAVIVFIIWLIGYWRIAVVLRRVDLLPHLRFLAGRCPHCAHPYVLADTQSAILCTECGKYYFDLIG